MNLIEAINILRNANYLVEASESDAYRAAKHVFAEFEQKEPERVKNYIEKLKSAGIQESWSRYYFKRIVHRLKLDNSEALYYLPGMLRWLLLKNIGMAIVEEFIPILNAYAKDGKKEIITRNSKMKLDRYLNLFISQKNNKDQYTEFVNRGLISFADLNDMLSEYKYKVKQESIEKKKAEEEEAISKMTSTKTDYKIVKLEKYEDTLPYHKYVEEYNWCYFVSRSIFDHMYAKRGVNMYLALKPGFETMSKKDPGFRDSMIAIDVGLDPKTKKPFLAASTARTNHMTLDGKPDFENPKGGDNCYTPYELSKILGCPYYIACPPPKKPSNIGSL